MAPYTGFSKSRCTSPGGNLLNELEEEFLEQAAAAIDFLPIPPVPVALPNAPITSQIGFDFAALVDSVRGANDIESVTRVKLQLIDQDSSLQRIGLSLPFLKELILDGSQLTSLRDLGIGMNCLKILRINRCMLISLDGVSGVPSLQELYAAHNPMVVDIWTCSSLLKLVTLDLSFTGIRSATQTGFLEPCNRLKHLSLMGCPASSPGSEYRAEVNRQLPRIQTLDGRLLAHNADVQQEDEENIIEREEEDVSPPEADNTIENLNDTKGEQESVFSTLVGVVNGSLASVLRTVRGPTPSLMTSSSTHDAGDELLDAARQWRENYQNFRQRNSDRWEEDNADENEINNE